MDRKYIIGQIRFVFEDRNRIIIHQNIFDLPNEANVISYSVGDRVELFDDGRTFIGKVIDVKHIVQADSSNNYVDSLQVLCSDSYEP